MSEPLKVRNIGEINAYYDGMREGITLFAWWKDGQQYVGTSTTLGDALRACELTRQVALGNQPMPSDPHELARMLGNMVQNG